MAEKGKTAGANAGTSWVHRGAEALQRAFNVREGRAAWPQIRKRFVGGSKLDGTHMCILIVAMLITPAATAYLYANSLWSMMLLSSGLGALASILGLFIGYSFNIAVGSCIVLTSAIFFLISFFIAPKQRKNKHALSPH